jgi:hypothetical protein
MFCLKNQFPGSRDFREAGTAEQRESPTVSKVLRHPPSSLVPEPLVHDESVHEVFKVVVAAVSAVVAGDDDAAAALSVRASARHLRRAVLDERDFGQEPEMAASFETVGRR